MRLLVENLLRKLGQLDSKRSAVVVCALASTWTTLHPYWMQWRSEVLLPDVNVLVYAHREDSVLHSGCLAWLENLINGDESFGLSEIVLSGFLRITTHPKIFIKPTPLVAALSFVEQLRGRPNHIPIAPGRRHWEIFRSLCSDVSAKGNLIPDAYLAAMAIESGCEWVTTDRDFSRFEGLRWRHPL